MKMLMLALSTLFITSAFASDAVVTQTVTCKKIGKTGINAKGTLKSTFRTYPSGAVGLVNTTVNLKNLQFVIDGVKGSTIAVVKASTEDSGDGNDVIVANFGQTSSERIKAIQLVLTQEGQRKAESSFTTSKGNVYTSACTASAGY
jgi:hypothetical protein